MATKLQYDEPLRWSFGALARGRHPTARHDGLPFAVGCSMAKLANQQLKQCALVQVRADLPEMHCTFGFYQPLARTIEERLPHRTSVCMAWPSNWSAALVQAVEVFQEGLAMLGL